MKNLFLIGGLICLLSLPASAQYASRIRPMPALPAACNPLNGDVVNLTAAGPTAGVYSCTSLNTWRPIGFSNNTLAVNQGTLTASTPVFNSMATWNNGAITFFGFVTDITNIASAGNSVLMSLRFNGTPQLQVHANGITNFGTVGAPTGGAQVNEAGFIGWYTRSFLTSSADGLIELQNAAGTGFDRLNIGPASPTNPAIMKAPTVGGQAQGIIIMKADGTAQVQANLGAAQNGAMIYCSDCTIASPCAGGGNGAIAKRLNGAWVCN